MTKLFKKAITWIFKYAALCLWALLCLFPLYWMLVTSLKGQQMVIMYPPTLIPLKPVLENYINLFRLYDINLWFKNSAIVSFSITLGYVVMCTMAGYAFAKIKFFAKKVVFVLVIVSMMLPAYVFIVPLFIQIVEMKLMNSYLSLILPSVAAPYGVFLMRQFILTIPDELIEAAEIDGCSHFRVFKDIIIHLVLPGIATLMIFALFNSWNEFLWPLIIINSDKIKTLPVGIASLQQHRETDFGLLTAAATCAAMPTIILFFIFQKYFITGLTMGAVKG